GLDVGDVHAHERDVAGGCVAGGGAVCGGAGREHEGREHGERPCRARGRPWPGHVHRRSVAERSLTWAGTPRVVTLSASMSPTWVWMQIAIIVFVVAGMIIAVTKLA